MCEHGEFSDTSEDREQPLALPEARVRRVERQFRVSAGGKERSHPCGDCSHLPRHIDEVSGAACLGRHMLHEATEAMHNVRGGRAVAGVNGDLDDDPQCLGYLRPSGRFD
ncbi:hypothetical protein OG301_36070 [Streptomyces platensis]|uniref:hypothetical protein n=1 Tax=Streptomyces TaxID=1883 RepID=UPI002E0EEAF7|nr:MULTISPECIES: hypothetical protein [Streptomyces]WSI53782.1 hypothetical protein OG229_03170 [Streptomyces platensis]WSX24565.1 hypothetical protein OG690_35350 [Streptomyces tubercidicus]WTI56318.1 hypothetical protein OG301_36070 [Streptomyces platensis]